MKLKLFALPIALLIVLSLLLIVACAPTEQTEQTAQTEQTEQTAQTEQTEQTAQTKQTHFLLHDWLEGIPCAPPCWQGITPGQTDSIEAVAILQHSSHITNVDVVTATVGRSISWDLIPLDQQGGSIEFYEKNDFVDGIILNQDGSITVQDVIDTYGPPTHIFAFAGLSHGTIWYRFEMIYLNQGLALKWHADDQKPQIGPDSRDFFLFFFEPNYEAYAKPWGNPPINQILSPWMDTFEFKLYCKGESCADVPE